MKKTERRCPKCATIKSIAEFYPAKDRTNGASYCKECCRIAGAKTYHENSVALLLSNRKWSLLNRLKRREYNRRWRELNREHHRINKRICNKKWHMNNKEKVKAQRLARRALLRGEIKRPEICEICSRVQIKYPTRIIAPAPIEMHHEDYNEPLKIQWLCKEHHKASHRIFLAENIKSEQDKICQNG
jgi:hypothetical protein